MRALAVIALASSVALAQPVASVVPDADSDATLTEVTPRPTEYDPTKPATTSAPAPEKASGVVVQEERSGDTARSISRTLLFVPRWLFWSLAQPVRGAAYIYEKYSLQQRVKATLFNDDGTYGIYPVGRYTTDFGFDLGARFVHYNLFGEREAIRVRANWGGRFQQGYGLELRSGERFGKRISASVETLYERRPNERFFGFGMRRLDDTPPDMPLDPADAATSARFRENWFRTIGRLQGRLAGPLSVRVSGAVALREFAPFERRDPSDPLDPGEVDDTQGIETRFDTSKIVGYDRGVDNVYLETELIYDSRRPSTRYMSRALDSTGWYASAHVGRAIGIAGDPTAFYRYGGELQRYIDLFNGTRVLALRVLVDATYGGNGRTDETLSFIDMPRLGGTEYLRGYPDGRFRDRMIALASAEYLWDLGNFLAAYAFVDVGRAMPKWTAVEDGELGIGVGGGVQLHTNASFLMRGQIAFSREGNTLLELVFSPSFGRRERAGRY